MIDPNTQNLHIFAGNPRTGERFNLVLEDWCGNGNVRFRRNFATTQIAKAIAEPVIQALAPMWQECVK
jgi:hypothetical protein